MSDIRRLEISLPSLTIQRKIGHTLSSIDDKIAINASINQNLAEQMKTIVFSSQMTSVWSDGKLDEIMCFYDSLRKPLSSREREGMERNYPYYGATSIVDYVNDYIFDGVFILVSEDGANVVDQNGHPLTQYAFDKFWVNNHAHVVKGKNGFSEAFLYAFLNTINIQSIVTGAAQPKVNQANLRNFITKLPNETEAKRMSSVLDPFLAKIIENDKQNAQLVSLRDALLPKLMSGEIDVSDLEF